MIIFILVIKTLISTSIMNGEEEECDSGWYDATSVDLGCLLLHETSLEYSAAERFCKGHNSILVEIERRDQFRMVSNILKDVSDAWYKLAWSVWWGGAIQVGKEQNQNWIWKVSEMPVQSWVWSQSEPGTDSDENYFIFQYSSENDCYFGGDYYEHSVAYPVCQKPISDADIDSSKTTSVPLIVGVSATGLLVIVIIIVIVWYMRKRNGRCEIIDENDQYGNREDYYEYEKDDYNTKVTDCNSMYDGDMKDEDEYDSE